VINEIHFFVVAPERERIRRFEVTTQTLFWFFSFPHLPHFPHLPRKSEVEKKPDMRKLLQVTDPPELTRRRGRVSGIFAPSRLEEDEGNESNEENEKHQQTIL
jgi:hypothetical protein